MQKTPEQQSVSRVHADSHAHAALQEHVALQAHAASQAHAVLRADSISVSWNNKVVVQNVSLEVFPGEIVGLIGKSGCGKTSLLHALAGLVTPVTGTVTIEGVDCTACPGAASYMFQKDLLIPSKTVIDNVCLPRIVAGIAPAQARQEAAKLFATFGLDGTQDRWPYQLSGGMRQRAALLRTYLMGNRVVLLDEPFSALDALTRTELREWYRTMACKLDLASLIVTHDVDEALVLADRIYVLHTSNAGEKPARISYELQVERPCEKTVLNVGGSGDVSAVQASVTESFSLTSRFLQYKKQLLEQLA